MNDGRFPTWIFRWLHRICPEHLYEAIEGDLTQVFQRDLEKFGSVVARRRLIWNALRFCRPGIILRNKFSITSNQLPMLENYFKTTYRSIWKSKLNFSF